MKIAKTRLALQITGSLLLAALLLRHVDLRALVLHLRQAHRPSLLATLLLLPPALLLRSRRWQLLFQDEDHHIGLTDATRLLLVGLGLDLFLPAGSGAVLKSYFGYRWTGIKERMVSISLVDKLIALAAVGLPGLAAALSSGRPRLAVVGAVVALPFAVAALIPPDIPLPRRLDALQQRWRERFDLRAFLRHMRVPPTRLAQAFALSVLGWLVNYLQLHLCFRMTGAPVTFPCVLAAAPLLTLGRLFPLALNGMGSDEMLIVFLFSREGVEPEQTLAAALLYRTLLLILPGFLGLSILAFPRTPTRTSHTPDDTPP